MCKALLRACMRISSSTPQSKCDGVLLSTVSRWENKEKVLEERQWVDFRCVLGAVWSSAWSLSHFISTPPLSILVIPFSSWESWGSESSLAQSLCSSPLEGWCMTPEEIPRTARGRERGRTAIYRSFRSVIPKGYTKEEMEKENSAGTGQTSA